MTASTVGEVFAKCAETYGDRPALNVKRGGHWQTTTWREYYDRTRRAARGMMRLGLEPGQGVAILGYNCPAWFEANMAAILAGGVPAGIYTTSTPEQCQYITDHADAALVVAENPQQLAKFKAVRAQLPKVKAFVLMNGADDDPDVHSFDELLALGDGVPETDLEARLRTQRPSEVCTLIYTSGTTGVPKAVMITHDNITWTAARVIETTSMPPGIVVMSYLPLSHIAEQIVSMHTPMIVGGWVWFAESMDTLGEDLRDARPHVFLGVPRVWEKIQAKMEAAGANNSGLKKKLVAWARSTGLASGFAEQKGLPKPAFHGLADKLVYSKVRERLGLDRCRIQITSAAPISRATLEFFLSLGLPIYEVYGMSECTGPATISLPGRYRTGSAGPCLPGAELKIAPDGEICMRGRHVFKGYYKNDAATRETIDEEGWLHSGDIGVIDEHGFLTITDRKKDLLITAGGENIAPQLIEGALKAIPVVAQAVVIGDRRKYISALLTLDPDKLAREAEKAGSPARTIADAARCDAFQRYVQTAIDDVNKSLARVQTVKRWVILPNELTVDGGELTPTMKIKRKQVGDKYKDQIESMYA